MKIKLKGFKTLDEFLNEVFQYKGYPPHINYGGKFQPFHIRHFDIYQKLCKKFGKENVFITTTDTVVYDDKHIMNFEEKKLVMTKMFNIDPNKIIKVKNNYAPNELNGMFPENTSYITVVGAKDADRLTKGGKYFEPYEDNILLKGYRDKGYVYVETNSPGIVDISATDIRNFFRDTQDEEELKKYFKKIYGKFDAQVFNMLQQKLNEEILNESGAFGHIEHIYDDFNLTFDNLRELVDLGLQGKLENAVEKTDGMTLAISWKNGKMIAARNKGHYKNFGENALDSESLKNMFIGRGEIGDAYNFAFDDLQNVLSKMSSKDLENIFENGKKFMHLEIIYIPTTNTIPYNTNLLVFHNITEYNESGEIVGEDRKASDRLAKIIKDINQNIQKTFKIQGSPYIDMKAIDDLELKKSEFNKLINNIQNKNKLGNNNTLLDYYKKEWEILLKKERPELDEIEQQGLIRRWCENDKSFGLNGKTLSEKNLEWAKEFEKTNLVSEQRKIKRPIELLFVKLAITILSNFKTFLAANPKESTINIKKELDKTITQIKSDNDETAINKMTYWLDRLQAAGGSESIFPSEGIVFNYKGKMYKLTGTFTDVHHILSILKYK